MVLNYGDNTTRVEFGFCILLPGAPMTLLPWTGGYMQWEVTMAAPVSTPLRSTTHAATSGWQLPACSRGAAAWAWLYWSCWISHHPPRPPFRFPPPAFDTGSPLGWPQPLLLQPRLALGRDATARFEEEERKRAGNWVELGEEAEGWSG